MGNFLLNNGVDKLKNNYLNNGKFKRIFGPGLLHGNKPLHRNNFNFDGDKIKNIILLEFAD